MISDELREKFASLLHHYVSGLKINGAKATGHVPWREDIHPSFSADLERGVWYDHAQQEGGGVKEFRERMQTNGSERQSKIVATYNYRDENGNLLFQSVRYEPKDFRQRRPDGHDGWLYTLNGVRRILYRLPEILKAETLYIVEGEKDVDRLWSLGIPATTNPQGAGKWREEYNHSLAGKRVVIVPDNDEIGEQHTRQVARSLLPVAASVKIVRLPDLPPKGDVSDWLNAGHSKNELTEIVEATPISKPEDLNVEQSSRNSLVLTKLSDVTPQPVRWLWRGYIPLGKVTIIDGDPGLGKSLISLDIAACISKQRPLPDGTLADLDEPTGTVILSVEDDLADTLRPRLDVADADVERIVHLTAIHEENGERIPTLADLDAIRTAIKTVKAKLVIIDPLMAYLPGDANSHKDQDIRRNLAPLAKLAAETGVAVMVVRHLNKSEGKNPLYRGGGSIGIIGAARSGLIVAKDSEDENRRILAVSKSNLAERAFVEERRRPKVIPHLQDERSLVQLVFAVLIRVSDRWNKKSFSALEQQQIRHLRRRRKLDEQDVSSADPQPEPLFRRSAASAA